MNYLNNTLYKGLIIAMLKKIIPQELIEIILDNVNLNNLFEIRLRVNSPIVINVCGQYKELKNIYTNKTIYADKRLIDYIVLKATDMSLYCYEDQLRSSFITMEGGIRIGVAGEVVFDNERIKTVKNFVGLNIRIPHEVKNCSSSVLKHVVDEYGVKSSLIISPPGAGKTTMLRDLSRQMSNFNKILNVLIVDERYELSACTNGKICMDVGKYSDIVSGANKKYCFAEGVRSMKPDVIVTDEIATVEDALAVENAVLSGVKVIASAHAYNHLELTKKKQFENLYKNRIFDRFIVLSERLGVGTIEGVFDCNFNRLQ